MYNHETIQYDKLLPAKIKLRDGSVDRCRGEPHWHEEMQLIYVDEMRQAGQHAVRYSGIRCGLAGVR